MAHLILPSDTLSIRKSWRGGALSSSSQTCGQACQAARDDVEQTRVCAIACTHIEKQRDTTAMILKYGFMQGNRFSVKDER
jgi:hypothetical protein